MPTPTELRTTKDYAPGSLVRYSFAEGGEPQQEKPPYPEGEDPTAYRWTGEEWVPKSDTGWLGPRRHITGATMTEFSIGNTDNPLDPDDPLRPSMVPTLTEEEIEFLTTLPVGVSPREWGEHPLGRSVLEKSRDHYEMRVDQGLSPFLTPEEEKEREGYAEGGEAENPFTYSLDLSQYSPPGEELPKLEPWDRSQYSWRDYLREQLRLRYGETGTTIAEGFLGESEGKKQSDWEDRQYYLGKQSATDAPSRPFGDVFDVRGGPSDVGVVDAALMFMAPYSWPAAATESSLILGDARGEAAKGNTGAAALLGGAAFIPPFLRYGFGARTEGPASIAHLKNKLDPWSNYRHWDTNPYEQYTDPFSLSKSGAEVLEQMDPGRRSVIQGIGAFGAVGAGGMMGGRNLSEITDSLAKITGLGADEVASSLPTAAKIAGRTAAQMPKVDPLPYIGRIFEYYGTPGRRILLDEKAFESGSLPTSWEHGSDTLREQKRLGYVWYSQPQAVPLIRESGASNIRQADSMLLNKYRDRLLEHPEYGPLVREPQTEYETYDYIAGYYDEAIADIFGGAHRLENATGRQLSKAEFDEIHERVLTSGNHSNILNDNETDAVFREIYESAEFKDRVYDDYIENTYKVRYDPDYEEVAPLHRAQDEAFETLQRVDSAIARENFGKNLDDLTTEEWEALQEFPSRKRASDAFEEAHRLAEESFDKAKRGWNPDRITDPVSLRIGQREGWNPQMRAVESGSTPTTPPSPPPPPPPTATPTRVIRTYTSDRAEQNARYEHGRTDAGSWTSGETLDFTDDLSPLQEGRLNFETNAERQLLSNPDFPNPDKLYDVNEVIRSTIANSPKPLRATVENQLNEWITPELRGGNAKYTIQEILDDIGENKPTLRQNFLEDSRIDDPGWPDESAYSDLMPNIPGHPNPANWEQAMSQVHPNRYFESSWSYNPSDEALNAWGRPTLLNDPGHREVGTGSSLRTRPDGSLQQGPFDENVELDHIRNVPNRIFTTRGAMYDINDQRVYIAGEGQSGIYGMGTGSNVAKLDIESHVGILPPNITRGMLERTLPDPYDPSELGDPLFMENIESFLGNPNKPRMRGEPYLPGRDEGLNKIHWPSYDEFTEVLNKSGHTIDDWKNLAREQQQDFQRRMKEIQTRFRGLDLQSPQLSSRVYNAVRLARADNLQKYSPKFSRMVVGKTVDEVPPAPLFKEWFPLFMKTSLNEAVEQGADTVRFPMNDYAITNQTGEVVTPVRAQDYPEPIDSRLSPEYPDTSNWGEGYEINYEPGRAAQGLATIYKKRIEDGLKRIEAEYGIELKTEQVTDGNRNEFLEIVLTPELKEIFKTVVFKDGGAVYKKPLMNLKY